MRSVILPSESNAAILAANLNGKRTGARSTVKSFLVGRLFDDRGVPMVATHACKGKVRYRYYVSRDLHHDSIKTSVGWRIPAREIEKLVASRLVEALHDPLQLLPEADSARATSDDLNSLLVRGPTLAEKASASGAQATSIMSSLIAKVQLKREHVEVLLDAQGLCALLNTSTITEEPRLTLPVALRRTGMALKLVTPSGSAATPAVDRKLIKAIIRGQDWWQEIVANPELTPAAIGAREGITSGYVVRLMRLAFLSPEVLTAVAISKASAQLSIASLTKAGVIPARWSQQSQSLAARFNG